MTKATALFAPALLAALLAGCADDASAPPPNTAATPPPAPTSVATTGDLPGSGIESTTNGQPLSSEAAAASPTARAPVAPATRTASAPTEAQPLDDAQILEVIHVANAGEIEQAKLAKSHAQSQRVKNFAAMMLKDHTGADDKELALQRRVKISPAESVASTQLASAGRAATQTLEAQSASAFDVSYAQTQVAEHQKVLDTLDQSLLPAAQSSDVKTFLTDVRRTVAAHLQRAKDLQASLQQTSSRE
jgi:putative membrane protein